MRTATPALVAYLALASENSNDMAVFVVDLYTFTLINGTVLKFCSGDRSIFYDATNTFKALNGANPDVPAIKRSAIKTSIGLSVDDLTIEIAATPLVMVDGTEMLAAFSRGDFDGAGVLVERLIMPTYGDTSLGKYILFSGSMGDITDITNVGAKLTVKALTDILSNPMPRNLYGPGCRHSLFDAGCTLSRGSFLTSGAVKVGASVISIPTNLTQPGPAQAPNTLPVLGKRNAPGSNINASTFWVQQTYISALGETIAGPESSVQVPINTVLTVKSPPAAAGAIGWNVYVGLQPGNGQLQNGDFIPIGTDWEMPAGGWVQGAPPPLTPTNAYFTQGIITFTSGRNNTISRYVLNYAAGGLVTILYALPFAPVAGDTFEITPGCDKQMSTCAQKFVNLINFGGQPFVPQPEAAI